MVLACAHKERIPCKKEPRFGASRFVCHQKTDTFRCVTGCVKHANSNVAEVKFLIIRESREIEGDVCNLCVSVSLCLCGEYLPRIT